LSGQFLCFRKQSSSSVWLSSSERTFNNKYNHIVRTRSLKNFPRCKSRPDHELPVTRRTTIEAPLQWNRNLHRHPVVVLVLGQTPCLLSGLLSPRSCGPSTQNQNLSITIINHHTDHHRSTPTTVIPLYLLRMVSIRGTRQP